MAFEANLSDFILYAYTINTKSKCATPKRQLFVLFLLRPERSEGLPFLCVASTRGNRGSGFHDGSCLEYWNFFVTLGRICPWPYPEGTCCSFSKFDHQGDMFI